MPDTPSGYHSRRYDYFHPQHRRARGGSRARSRGRCQGCGYWLAEHAHHWLLRYLPPWETTSDHLTALCCVGHRVMTLLRRFLSVGRDAGRFLAILEVALTQAGETVHQQGRWYVPTSWPKASERGANRGVGVGIQTASGRRQSRGRAVCA